MKKIISLLVVLTMAVSCFGLVALADAQLPECDVNLLTGDELNVAEDVTLDFGMNFTAIDTEETVMESPYKDYLCDFEITFSEDVNAILAGNYGEWGWIVLKTEAGETFGDLTEFGYKFNKDEKVKVMATAASALANEGVINKEADAIFTYEQIVSMVGSFDCGVKIVDEKNVDVTLELCLYNPENGERLSVVNPVTFNHTAAKAPEALISPLTKDELNVKGVDLAGNEYNETLDFGMNFKTLDTVAVEPFEDYSVDFEIEFSEDATAVLAGNYGEWGWIAIKNGSFIEGVTEEGYSFEANKPVRVMKLGEQLINRIAYWEVVESIRDFNCGVKLTSGKDVTITLSLCMYETDGNGNETGFKYVIGEPLTFDCKTVSFDENATAEEKIENINSATSITEENKQTVVDTIKDLKPEEQMEIKTEVYEAVASAPIVPKDDEDIGVKINAIEDTVDADMIFVVKKPAEGELDLKDDQVAIDIDAYEGTISEENEFKGELAAPIVVKIPLSAFGEGVTGLSALYHEHDGVVEKIDFVVKDDFVIFTVNKFSSFIGVPVTLAAGEATVELVELTGVAEGTTAFDVLLKGDTFRTVQYFGAGEFVVNVKDVLDINGAASDASAKFELNPAIENANVYQYGDKYVVSIEDTLANLWTAKETNSENNAFKLGTITVTGWGKSGTLELTDILMNKHTDSVANGGTNTDVIALTSETSSESFNIPVPQRTLDINVLLAHGVKNQKAPYQAMTITITRGGEEVITVSPIALGKDEANVKYEKVDGVDNEAYYKTSVSLDLNASYVVTVSGAGYRTSSKTVNMTSDKEVNFWNNINGAGLADFLAGDIVADDIIDIYDISAVVSYFDQRPNNVLEASIYSQYDLNRDGYINSKDVVIVNNGWGK